METAVESFRDRLNKPWFVGVEPSDALCLFNDAVETLRHKVGPVVVVIQDDRAFLIHALAALALQRPCILATPSWPAEMLKSVAVPVDTVLGDIPWLSYVGTTDRALPLGSLLIATGGSGGRLRFARHTWETLCAAVEGYRQFWDVQCLDVVNVLPLHHVGGFVPAMRSFITGGQLILSHWKDVEAGTLPELPSKQTHISLVPTQLKRLLTSDTSCAWLRRFGAVLVGGGSAPQSLLAEAFEKGVSVLPAYGMTEALGTVALARVGDCESAKGEVLPHWRVQIVDGEIQLAGDALFKGYLPGEVRTDEWHPTGDLGELDDTGRLSVLGRKDRLIITGGEKVNPAVVEEAIRQTGLCRDVAVLGIDDPDWGQRVVAVIEGNAYDEETLKTALRSHLPMYAIPKTYRFMEKLPRNEMGKLDRAGL